MKLYVIGDSISIQYGPYLKAYLKGVVEYARKEGEESAMDNLDDPKGANGGDSDMVLTFLKSKAKLGGIDTDLLLINCGLHDIKTKPGSNICQTTVDKYRANLESIICVSKQLNCFMIWVRTTPFDV